jgi:hypothetical protein
MQHGSQIEAEVLTLMHSRSRPIWDFTADLELAKAALLYADDVTIRSSGLGETLIVDAGTTDQRLERDSPYPPEIQNGLDVLALDLLGHHAPQGRNTYPENRTQEPLVITKALNSFRELRTGVKAGLVRLNRKCRASDILSSWLDGSLTLDGVPVMNQSNAGLFGYARVAGNAGKPRADATLAAALIGELDAFPDAEMDVILDVRKDLAAARVGFRAAMRNLGDDLAGAAEEGVELDRAVTDLRVKEVDPALDRLRDELDALGARDTLLRLSSSSATVASATATLGIVASGATGAVDLPSLAAGIASAPAIAGTAKEMLTRRELTREVRAHPYWLLHRADGLLASR